MAGQKSYEELATELTIAGISKGLILRKDIEGDWNRFYKMIQNAYDKPEEK